MLALLEKLVIISLSMQLSIIIFITKIIISFYETKYHGKLPGKVTYR